jgi:hypothetical protein
MASGPAEIVVRLDDSTSAQLERLIAVLDRLAAVMERQPTAGQPKAPGPYLEGNGQ